VYALQLLLNAAWAPVFFGLKSIGAALFVAVALWLAVAWTVREFARVSGVAALLLLPYLAWVGVAVAMNLGLWQLNP
jgi:benzodiazapine receptor